MFNLYSKTKEKNIVLSAILAVILLFPLITLVPSTALLPTTTKQTEILANNACVELSSNEKDSSSNAISLDKNLNEKPKKYHTNNQL